MKVLVVVPTLMLDASFSAPLAWLFGRHTDRVEGVYGFELTEEMVRNHDRFIVEINWFVELHEFGLIVRFIRAHNPSARILFGGMYAGIHHREIFARYDVDLFILGDNELPIRMYLEGTDPRSIPNFVGRDFRNPIGYRFEEAEYADLELDLDWFPSYFRHRNPRDLFCLPHLITTKGGCNVVHDGCGYCAGSKGEFLRELYGRPPVEMSNGSLMQLLRKAARRFREASLYVTRAADYDFAGRSFDLDVTIEIDSRITGPQAEAICGAFRKVFLLLPIYAEGISGGEIDGRRVRDLLRVEDEDHLVRFYVLRKDTAMAGIPPDHVMYADLAFPEAATWDFYTDFDRALAFSRRFYAACRRHFVDGRPHAEVANPSYMWQCLAFSKGYPDAMSGAR